MAPPLALPVSSATKVLRIPELIRFIASFNTVIDEITPATAFTIDRTDLVRLSQVCQQTFKTLVPAVWESVYGVQNLLKLIKSASFVYDDASKRLLDVVLPDSTDRIYERFDFYASYVKYLEVYGANNEAFGVQQWSTLITRSRNCPLLPHLRSIIFSRNPSPGHEHDEARWVDCFAAITTTEVITKFDKWEPGMFTYAAASRLLKAIADNCPMVNALALHPYDKDDESDSDSPNALIEATVNPWYQYLQSLRNLRWLSISEGWLCPPSLQALAQIRTITSLVIHPGDCKGFDILQDSAPSNLLPHTFRILHHLVLRGNCPLTTAKILGIRAMVCHVTQLFIHVGPDLDEGQGESSEFGNNLLLMLCNTPIESPVALETMAELPLRAVTLENMYLGLATLSVNLGIIWPNVTVLSMPHQSASLWELSKFATMPQLRRLTICLDLTTTLYTPDDDQISHLPRAPLRALEGSLGSCINLNFRIIEHNVKFIARFWPDACFIQPQTEGKGGVWSALVLLVDHLIYVYTMIHSTDQRSREQEARRTLEEDREAWETAIKNAGFPGGRSDPWPDYVYGGPDITFDYV